MPVWFESLKSRTLSLDIFSCNFGVMLDRYMMSRGRLVGYPYTISCAYKAACGMLGEVVSSRGGTEEGAELGLGVGRITYKIIKNSIHPFIPLCIWGLT